MITTSIKFHVSSNLRVSIRKHKILVINTNKATPSSGEIRYYRMNNDTDMTDQSEILSVNTYSAKQ